MNRLKHRRRGRIRIAVVFAIAWSIGISVGWSQASLQRALTLDSRVSSGTTNSPEAVPPGAPGNLQEKLAKARADLAAARNEVGATNSPAGISLENIDVRRALLERLVRFYEQQISYTAELAAVKNRRSELAREAQSWTGFAEPRPYSILLTDELHEGVQMERLEVANGESALSMLETLIEEHRALLKQAEEKIRQLDEQLEGNKNAATASELNRRREIERLRSQAAGAAVAVLDLERQISQERLAGSRVHLGLLERQLVIANAGAVLTEDDVEKVNGRLDNEQRQLERELAEAETRQRAAAEALDALRRTQTPPEAGPALTARLAEQLETRRAQLETADTAVNGLRFMLQAGSVKRAIWEVRLATYRSSNVDTIRQSKRRLDEFARRVDLWKSYYRQQLQGAATQVSLLEARLAGLDAASDLAPLVRERLAALRERDQLLLRIVRSIEQGERLIQRLGEGLRDATQSLPLLGRVRNIFSDSRSFFAKIWDLELFVAQDTITVDGQPITGKRSVTLGKILSAILILAIGYWLAGLVAGFTEPIFVKRFKIEPNQANLIRRWVRVVLVFALAFFSLVSVKIPLTVFAFAGGALAIGLGFGLQTLLKNFVSGIIILFERPFRVGDVLEIAGQRGTVSSIGIRSSVLQSWDGTETLIPNSTLLENNLTNWTYSNRIVRFNVKIGVAYGSDTRRVVQLLCEIAERHGLVEKEPKPQVLFTNFGESTLDFELRFWVDVVKANSAQVASDLRQMIAASFAESGIVIAFAQRDLHLDTARPLAVQIVPASERSSHEDQAAKPDAPANNGQESRAETTAQPRDSTPAVKMP